MVVEGPHQTLIKCVKELKGDNESWSMLSIWIAFKISATDPHQHLTDPYQTLLVEYALSLQLNPSISKQFKNQNQYSKTICLLNIYPLSDNKNSITCICPFPIQPNNNTRTSLRSIIYVYNLPSHEASTLYI